MRFLKWLGIVLIILIVTYFLGPSPASPKYTSDLPVIPAQSNELEKYIRDHESLHKLKPDNQARIVWANDSLKQPTEYAVVYLHGFSGSQGDGDPVHYDFAKKFGCNLYLSRLAYHGLDTTEALVDFTAEGLWNSAKEAYSIGRQLGKKIILLSTSTGGTLALKLAAEYPDIAGLILLSPNIAINDPNAWVLNNHWGLQVAKMLRGNYINGKDTDALSQQYWYAKYRIESLVQLEEMLETTMKESAFKKVTQPVLLLYYYKDEKHQDDVVKVSAMKRMFMQLGTPSNLKRQIPIPNANTHVIGSRARSKDVASVEKECNRFAMDILKLPTQ